MFSLYIQRGFDSQCLLCVFDPKASVIVEDTLPIFVNMCSLRVRVSEDVSQGHRELLLVSVPLGMRLTKLTFLNKYPFKGAVALSRCRRIQYRWTYQICQSEDFRET